MTMTISSSNEISDNFRTLSYEDCHLLNTYDPKTHILAVKKTEDDLLSLEKIERTYLTCQNCFLRVFSFGPLAQKQIHLVDIAEYFRYFDWSAVKSGEKNTEEYRAYLKVCEVANKVFRVKKSDSLYNSVATESAEKCVEFKLRATPQFDVEEFVVVQKITINPCTTVQDIKALVHKNLVGSSIIIAAPIHVQVLTEEGKDLPDDELITSSTLQKMRIIAEQSFYKYSLILSNK